MHRNYLGLTQVGGTRRKVNLVPRVLLVWTVAVPGLMLHTSALFTASASAQPHTFTGVTFLPEVAPVPAVSLVDEGVRVQWAGVNLSNGSASSYRVVRTGSDGSVQDICSGTSAPIRQVTTDSCVDTGVLANVSYTYTEQPVLKVSGATTWSRPASSASPQILAPKLRFGGVGLVSTSTTATPVSVAFPTNAVAGDVAILIVRTARKTPVTAPVGWNTLVQLASNGPQSYLLIAWKVVGTETSVNVQMQGTAQGSAGWVAIYKRTPGNNSTPVSASVSAPADNGTALATFTQSSPIITSVNNAAVVSIATVLASNTLSLSNSAGYTVKSTNTAAAGSSGFALGIADQLAITNGTTVNAPTWSQSGTPGLWQVATIAFS